MNVAERQNKKGDKTFFYFDYGRKKGGRISTGIFIHTSPRNQTEKNFNKEALALLDTKKAELTLDSLSTGSAYIPAHKLKKNFFEFYEEYIKTHKTNGNRHLQGSLNHFREFTGLSVIAPIDITEDLCKRYNKYLLAKFNGDTPMNYFSRFKEVIRAATKAGYYRSNPCEEISAKANPSLTLKENLEVPEYLKLLITPCLNEVVKEAFIFCCYTGLRFVDVDDMEWLDIKENILTTRIIQSKTGEPVTLTLHPIAKAIIDKRRRIAQQRGNKDKKVFRLPKHDGCNKILRHWVKIAGIVKHITWSCARLSFSILLQDKNVDDATVAYLLGHTTTHQVKKTYKRHRPKDQTETIGYLPSPALMPYFLNI